MTLDNAYAAFQEDKLGSLEAGKWADFVILDKNPMDVSPDDIQNITVEETWVGGQPVYKRTVD